MVISYWYLGAAIVAFLFGFAVDRMDSQLQKLINKDGVWIYATVFIATLSALAPTWIFLGPMISLRGGNVFGFSIYSSVILATSLPATLFSRKLFKPSRAGNRLWFGLILGGFAALSAHLLSGVISVVIINILEEGIWPVGEILGWVYLAAALGIVGLKSSTLILGAFIGAILGWLYDRTHPISETSILNEA